MQNLCVPLYTTGEFQKRPTYCMYDMLFHTWDINPFLPLPFISLPLLTYWDLDTCITSSMLYHYSGHIFLCGFSLVFTKLYLQCICTFCMLFDKHTNYMYAPLCMPQYATICLNITKYGTTRMQYVNLSSLT